MKILEYGNFNNKKLMLIHGFQLPYQIWNEYIEYFKDKYHVLVVVLEGHYPDNNRFISFKDIASKIEDYYIPLYGNNIDIIFGMSLGGIIAANLWASKKLNINKILFDGSPLIPYPKMLKSYFTKFYLSVTYKTQNRDTKTINQAVNSIIPEKYLNQFFDVIDNLTDENITRYIDAWGNYKLPDDIISSTKLYYFHGTKMNEMIAKKSAKYIKKYYSNSEVKCFKGKGHCEVSLFNEAEMIKELDNIL